MKAKNEIKAMRRNAREQVPVGSIRSKVVPMKKKDKLEKIAKREMREE